jgi:hypothetical protein
MGCNLYLYHHKVLRSPMNPEPSLPPIIGKFGHRGNEIYFDRLDAETLFSFQSPMDIAKFYVKPMPLGMKPSFVGKLLPNITWFSNYEFNRLTALKNFLGDRDEVWNHYIPVVKEYHVDDMTIGVDCRVDVVYAIPEGFYGDNPECMEVGDYKTGKVPPCSRGIKTDKKTGKVEKVPITMGDDVETQIMFEVLFLRHFGIAGNPNPRILYGKVIYTSDGTTVTQPVTDHHLEKVFEKLKRVQWMVENRAYSFNSWQCNKMHCDYDIVCIRSPSIDLMERARINRLYKQDKEEACQFLLRKVNEIHEGLASRDEQQQPQEQELVYL